MNQHTKRTTLNPIAKLEIKCSKCRNPAKAFYQKQPLCLACWKETKHPNRYRKKQ